MLLILSARLRYFTEFFLGVEQNLHFDCSKTLFAKISRAKGNPTFVAFLFALVSVSAHAQQFAGFQARQASPHNLIVGLLSGKNDNRDLTIVTREGTFAIHGPGGAKPFEVQEESLERVVISFKNHALNTGGTGSSDVARPQTIIYRFFRTERGLISAIILDEIDYALFESETSAAEIQKATRKYRILPLFAPANAVELIGYNLAHPVLRERAVRQALSYAIRREEIKRRFLFMKADIAVGPFQKESRFFPPGMNEYSYDPKKALLLLHSLGWRDTNHDQILDRNGEPLSFRLYYDQSTELKEQIIRQIKINWGEIGIQVQPLPLSANEINDRLRSGNFDAVLLSQTFEETLFSLENFFNPGFLNYTNPRLLQAFNNARRYQGTEAFRTIMQRIQIIINEDQPVSFLYHPWLRWHVINYLKFDNFLDGGGNLKPYQEWELRRQP